MDDDNDAADLLAHVLGSAGADIVESHSAEKASRNRRQHFDALISDIGMPDKDGFQLIREIRNIMENPAPFPR